MQYHKLDNKVLRSIGIYTSRAGHRKCISCGKETPFISTIHDVPVCSSECLERFIQDEYDERSDSF